MAGSYVQQMFDGISGQIDGRFIVGNRKTLDLITIAYLNRGHVLIEGPPGTGKTKTANLFAKILAKSFKRIQFTSDLLPADIIGSHVYLQSTESFRFVQGPIFSSFVLADEVNRAPPRTQSALLEAMEERQVTVEGQKYGLADDFFVIATQNPQDLEGTFPLPEAQTDRFMFQLKLNHGTKASEKDILKKALEGSLDAAQGDIQSLQPDLQRLRDEVAQVRFDESLLTYVTHILEATRKSPKLSLGCSIRAGMALLSSARILAASAGRDFVTPDDIKALVLPAMRHRVQVSPEAQMSRVSVDQVLLNILESVPFPK